MDDLGAPRPDDLRLAASRAVDALTSLADADWTRPAHGLAWDCRQTLNHTASALDWFSLNLGTPTPERFRLSSTPEDACSILDLLSLIRRRAAVLAALAAASDPAARGFHYWGQPDPAGYLAMGCAEILLHAHDIVRGQGRAFEPPDALCRRVAARLFPWASADLDGWSALRWATGRLSLAGHPDVPPDWAWHASPVAEWDGTVKTRASY